MNRNQNIPPDRRSVDGIVGGRNGNKRKPKRQSSFEEPFVKHRKPLPGAAVDIGDAYRPKTINKSVNNTSLSKTKGTDKQIEPEPGKKLSRRQQKRQDKLTKKAKKANLPTVQGKQQRPKRPRRIGKRIIIGLIIVLLIGGGYFGFKSWAKLNNIFRGGGSSAVLCGEVTPDMLKTEGDGRVNILLLGIGGSEQPDGPNLTDTIMIASINPLNNSVKLLSIPRDLWVPINGQYHKINEAYEEGLFAYQYSHGADSDEWPAIKAGFKSINKVVSGAVGVPINFDALVSYKAFKQAISAVGGIDIYVPETLSDPTMAWENNWSPVIAKKGQQHMGSKQALIYVRSRHSSARGDFDRAERQRAVLEALQGKVLSAGTLANPLKVNDLIDALGNNVRTNIGGEERTCLINVARKIDGSQIKSIDLYDYVQGDSSATGSSIQVPKAGMYDYSAVQSYVRNQLRDSYIARENAEITVLNGTTQAGVATKVADELKSYGYRVGKIGDAPDKDYYQTQIVNVTKKDSPKYTLNYLQRRLGGRQIDKLPKDIQPGAAKIVIIVGSDAANY